MLEVLTGCGASFQTGFLSIVEEMRRSTLCPRCRKYEEITSVRRIIDLTTCELGPELLPAKKLTPEAKTV